MPAESSNFYQSFKNKKSDYNQIISEFNKNILFNIFFRNKQFLLNNSDNVSFNKGSWAFRPEVFCQDYYSAPHYYHIILLVNNLGTVFDFYSDNLLNNIIIAPKNSAIDNIFV